MCVDRVEFFPRVFDGVNCYTRSCHCFFCFCFCFLRSRVKDKGPGWSVVRNSELLCSPWFCVFSCDLLCSCIKTQSWSSFCRCFELVKKKNIKHLCCTFLGKFIVVLFSKWLTITVFR